MRRPVLPTSGRVQERLSIRKALLLTTCLLLASVPAFAQRRQAVGRSAPPTADIVRFLEQARFGPTPDLVPHVQAVGIEGYLQEQFTAPLSAYPSVPQQPLRIQDGCPDGSPATCRRDNYSMFPLQASRATAFRTAPRSMTRSDSHSPSPRRFLHRRSERSSRASPRSSPAAAS